MAPLPRWQSGIRATCLKMKGMVASSRACFRVFLFELVLGDPAEELGVQHGGHGAVLLWVVLFRYGAAVPGSAGFRWGVFGLSSASGRTL